jgi:hypothetical protein
MMAKHKPNESPGIKDLEHVRIEKAGQFSSLTVRHFEGHGITLACGASQL